MFGFEKISTTVCKREQVVILFFKGQIQRVVSMKTHFIQRHHHFNTYVHVILITVNTTMKG